MFKWLYSIGLVLISLAWLPKLLQKKYRVTLAQRWGIGLPCLKSEKPMRLWVHAVSLGEAQAIIPLVKRLKNENPDLFIILSTQTQTGMNAAKKELPEADHHLFLPFDLIVRKVVREAKPTLVLVSETDFWFNFLDEAKKNGAKVALVNGKLSERSMRLYHLFPQLLKPVDRFIVQGEVYKNRFLQVGIDQEKIKVSGNLKLDSELEEMPLIPNKKPVLVIGSTHHPEEKQFLDALKEVWKHHPDLQVFLVPRHPERFDAVAKLIEIENIPYSRSSAGLQHERLTLVDEMGKLKGLYRQATLSAIGGSWTPKVGGHNILEPAFFAKPLIFGPYMHSQPDFCDLVLASHAGLQVPVHNLAATLTHLLSHPEEAHRLGQAAYSLIQKNQGALKKTLDEIPPLC